MILMAKSLETRSKVPQITTWYTILVLLLGFQLFCVYGGPIAFHNSGAIARGGKFFTSSCFSSDYGGETLRAKKH